MPAWADRTATEAELNPESLARLLQSITTLLPAYVRSLGREHGLESAVNDKGNTADDGGLKKARSERIEICQKFTDACKSAYAIAERIGPRLEYGLPNPGHVLSRVRFQVDRAVRIAFIAEERVDWDDEPDLEGLGTDYGDRCAASLMELAEIIDSVVVDSRSDRMAGIHETESWLRDLISHEVAARTCILQRENDTAPHRR